MVSFQKSRNYFLSSAKPKDVSCFVCFKTKNTKRVFSLTDVLILLLGK